MIFASPLDQNIPLSFPLFSIWNSVRIVYIYIYIYNQSATENLPIKVVRKIATLLCHNGQIFIFIFSEWNTKSVWNCEVIIFGGFIRNKNHYFSFLGKVWLLWILSAHMTLWFSPWEWLEFIPLTRESHENLYVFIN